MFKALLVFAVLVIIGLAVGMNWQRQQEETASGSPEETAPAGQESEPKSWGQDLVERIKGQSDTETAPSKTTTEQASGGQYRISYPDVSQYLSGSPVLVQATPLSSDQRATMERQLMLFKCLMHLDSGQDELAEQKEALEAELDRLRYAFPVAVGGGEFRYQTPPGADSSTRVYQYPVRKDTNERLVNDFRHTVENARLYQVDQIVGALRADLDRWERQMGKISSSSSSYDHYKQVKADRSFLQSMPAYIDEWVRLGEKVDALEDDTLDPVEAGRQWAEFEEYELPGLNASIEQVSTNTWPLAADGTVSADVGKRDTLYLRLNVAGRDLYLPLQPAWDEDLGMAIVPVR
ncbi:MAG: hypothetical protein Q7Q73_08335 [Verrucomicrobiota bacterium JB024]|nr:hypothetical protein [Verrucomicrobiota bacterium JB024]